MSGLPWLQPCEISALKIGDDFAGGSAVNVQFLGLSSLNGNLRLRNGVP
jgi:hypothetical protein